MALASIFIDIKNSFIDIKNSAANVARINNVCSLCAYSKPRSHKAWQRLVLSNSRFDVGYNLYNGGNIETAIDLLRTALINSTRISNAINAEK